jgi:hypothetical protein
MIVSKLDFSGPLSEVEAYLLEYLPGNRYRKVQRLIRQNLLALAKANLEIYKANMQVLRFRAAQHQNLEVYSRLELRARRSGEKRVQAKSNINRLISSVFPGARKNIGEPEGWMSDDVVYSVGEMIDRVIIEKIKVADYSQRQRIEKGRDMRILREKIKLSNKWSGAVRRFLRSKLKEISKKNYYECVAETRTYNLQGIKK